MKNSFPPRLRDIANLSVKNGFSSGEKIKIMFFFAAVFGNKGNGTRKLRKNRRFSRKNPFFWKNDLKNEK